MKSGKETNTGKKNYLICYQFQIKMSESLISNAETALKCQKKVINKEFVINRGIIGNGDKKKED